MKKKFKHLKLSDNTVNKLEEVLDLVASMTGEDNADLAIEILKLEVLERQARALENLNKDPIGGAERFIRTREV